MESKYSVHLKEFKEMLKKGFLSLHISKKLLLGYLPLSALTILTALFALSSLYRLNDINGNIINSDMRTIDSGEKLISHLLAQEQYGKRFMILKTTDMKSIFFERSAEFRKETENLEDFSGRFITSSEGIDELHDEYESLFKSWFEYGGNDMKGAAAYYEDMIRNKQEELSGVIKNLIDAARHDLNEQTQNSSRIGTRAFLIITSLCLLSVLFGIGSAMYITHYISSSITRLKSATKRISEGAFEEVPRAESGDEIGELTEAFGTMTRELKRLKKLDLDASPLTYLPGNSAIENLLEYKISKGEPFSFCYIDLDNFKAFNDYYGYARGSEVLKATSKVVEDSVATVGTEGDFVGHIGGDDFVVITEPSRHALICEEIIKRFDEMIPGFYNSEDIEKGYIKGKTRQGKKANFPIMTVSTAVVTNERRKFANHIQVGEVAAELKEHAKSMDGSAYVVDRRTDLH